MAILLDLAHELLLQILESLAPIEMVSFATSCKRIHTVAQDNLTLHRQRIERYQNVTLWGCFRHQDQPHPILLLRDICNDWRVAYYTRSLVIECCGEQPFSMDEASMDEDSSVLTDFSLDHLIAQDVETVRSVLPEIIIPVRKMLSMALRWDEAKVNEVLDMTEYGARGAILGLLIVSLPAIKSISFKDYVWCDELWIDSLKSITYQQNPYLGSSEANFLMDVSELNLDQQYENRSAKSWSIIPFVTLPSLQVIRGASIDSSSFDDFPFVENDGLPPSPVTVIDLQRTTLPTDDLDRVLRYVQDLKRFRYDYRPQSHFIHKGAEPGGIIQALLGYASHSLESLALTSATPYRSPHDEDIKGSLQAFEVLKDLHLPSNTFLADRSKAFKRSLGTEEIPKLVDILPASIETVRLDGEMKWKSMAALLVGLPEDKAECLPKLKEILFTVEGDEVEAYKQGQVLADLDQKQGMVLQLDEATGYAWRYSGRFVF